MPWLRSVRHLWTMREKDRKRWECTRAKGRRHFILVRSVLGWGLGTAFLFTALLWVEGEPSSRLLPNLVASVVVFPLGGILWGSWMWSILEGQYQSGSRP